MVDKSNQLTSADSLKPSPRPLSGSTVKLKVTSVKSDVPKKLDNFKKKFLMVDGRLDVADSADARNDR